MIVYVTYEEVLASLPYLAYSFARSSEIEGSQRDEVLLDVIRDRVSAPYDTYVTEHDLQKKVCGVRAHLGLADRSLAKDKEGWCRSDVSLDANSLTEPL